jgi:hypothetical protein
MSAATLAPRISFQIAEEGEAIGTLRQFAERLLLSPPAVLSCLEASDASVIRLDAGTPPTPVLIVDADGMDALLECAVNEVNE